MYLFISCWSLLVLANISVTADIFHKHQRPRFYGVTTGRSVNIMCYAMGDIPVKLPAEWYKAERYPPEHKFKVDNSKLAKGADSRVMTLKNLETEDSGIYFCKVNNTWGLGTEVQVFRPADQKAAERRTNMKDFIIFVQTFLLLLCIALPLVKYNKLKNKEEAVYEEPEDDHTYEGLEIERCGGDLYEDITVYSQCPEEEVSLETPGQE